MTDHDYNVALQRIGDLMGATPGTDAFAELERLADLLVSYEDALFPIGPPSDA